MWHVDKENIFLTWLHLQHVERMLIVHVFGNLLITTWIKRKLHVKLKRQLSPLTNASYTVIHFNLWPLTLTRWHGHDDDITRARRHRWPQFTTDQVFTHAYCRGFTVRNYHFICGLCFNDIVFVCFKLFFLLRYSCFCQIISTFEPYFYMLALGQRNYDHKVRIFISVEACVFL